MVSKESIRFIIRRAKLSRDNGEVYEGDYIVMNDEKAVVITDIINEYFEGKLNMNQAVEIGYVRVNA